MLSIESAKIKVEIALHGGNLTSVFDKILKEELLWQGDFRSWAGQDLVIFPWIARLKDGFYTVDGKKYAMDIHGLACYADFKVVKKSQSSVTLLFQSNQQTMQNFPFSFAFFITYSLQNNTIDIAYQIQNFSKTSMPFAVGGHPAFILNAVETADFCDTSGNFLVFDQKQPLTQVVMDESNYFVKGFCNRPPQEKMELKKEMFLQDAAIFKGVQNGVTLVRGDGRKIHFKLEEVPFLSIWSHKTQGNYVCVEPWWGLPDESEPVRELSEKPFLQHLAPNKTFCCHYEIEIEP